MISSKVKVVAHRGSFDLFPENTLEGIEAALYRADLVEFDVFLSKDQIPVVFHDRHLSEITNVAEHPKFKDRYRASTANGKKQEEYDWWLVDFTYQELQELRVTQKHKHRPSLNSIKFRIPTLEEVLATTMQAHRTHSKLQSGLLIELKDQQMDKCSLNDILLCNKVLALLKNYNIDQKEKCRELRMSIMLESFSMPMIKELDKLGCSLECCLLYNTDVAVTENVLKKDLVPQAVGVGISDSHALDSAFLQLIKAFNLSIFYWTVIDDEAAIPLNQASFFDVYQQLSSIGISHIITQFPERAKAYLK